MSDKKKKKGGDKAATPTSADGLAAKLDPAEERTFEYYETKLRDLTEKNDRLKSKCDSLTKDNEILARAQTKSNHDKQDIVEFLNIRVGEHEKMITSLESKARHLEEEKRELEIRSKTEIEGTKTSMQSDLEILQIQCTKYKAELSELTAFSAKKEEMEMQIKQYKALLEKKEAEYRDTIHNLERKVLQDKNQMKREMLQKVNEAVANFRRVADQQMAETTKRAIRENMSITTQLKKMSAKTIELIAENDSLSTKVTKLKTNNALLNESEQELAKRNQANQRVIKMLVEKLKESDQMLELAFESEHLGQNQGIDEDGNPNRNGGLGLNGRDGSVEYLTEKMKEEIEALQSDYNVLAARLTEVANVTDELELVFQDVFGKITTEEDYDNLSAEALDYMRSSLIGAIERLKTLTWFESSSTQSQEQGLDAPQLQINVDPESNNSEVEVHSKIDEADEGQEYIDAEEDQTQLLEGNEYVDDNSVIFDSIEQLVDQNDAITMSETRLMAESGEFSDGIRNEGDDPYGLDPEDQDLSRSVSETGDDYRGAQQMESGSGSRSSNARWYGADGVGGGAGTFNSVPTSRTMSRTVSGTSRSASTGISAASYILRPNKQLTGYQQKVERNFMAMISTIPSRRKPAGGVGAAGGGVVLTTVRMRGGGKQRDVGVQTNPLPFGKKTSGSALLGELRPWGAPAECLPKKGLGLYKARALARPPLPLENRVSN